VSLPKATVVAVAADGEHHFSKAPRRHILLLEGHGVEDPTPALSFGTAI
jgi:hypothetical protein